MKKIIIPALIMAGILTGAADCGASRDIYAKVCVDTQPKGDLRADDDKCQSDRSDDRYRWRYYRDNVHIPAVGWKLPSDAGQWNQPDNAALVYIPAKGGDAYHEFHAD